MILITIIFPAILIAIIFPALSFFLNGKIFHGIVALVLHIIACLTFVFFGIGFIIWLVLAIWAATSLSKYKNEELNKKMLEEIRNAQKK